MLLAMWNPMERSLTWAYRKRRTGASYWKETKLSVLGGMTISFATHTFVEGGGVYTGG
jgi:hypothetical protein